MHPFPGGWVCASGQDRPRAGLSPQALPWDREEGRRRGRGAAPGAGPRVPVGPPALLLGQAGQLPCALEGRVA